MLLFYVRYKLDVVNFIDVSDVVGSQSRLTEGFKNTLYVEIAKNVYSFVCNQLDYSDLKLRNQFFTSSAFACSSFGIVHTKFFICFHRSSFLVCSVAIP